MCHTALPRQAELKVKVTQQGSRPQNYIANQCVDQTDTSVIAASAGCIGPGGWNQVSCLVGLLCLQSTYHHLIYHVVAGHTLLS